MSNEFSRLIERKKAMLGIDQSTQASLRKIVPTIDAALPSITESFYAHMQSFPEARKVFSQLESLKPLQNKQISHWRAMFSQDLDEAYVRRALRIGEVHFTQKVAPYLYIAGYTYFQCELLGLISEKNRGDGDLSQTLTSLTRVISLDMDLAISVYTRAVWRSRTETVHL